MFTTQNIIWDNSTDANFRGWVALIHNQLLAMGLVATADTGQVDVTTVTRPLASSTVMGYRMYRFADALQGAAPVLLKIRFGSAGAAASPSIQVSVGKVTDGAGTFIGVEKSAELDLDGASGGAASLRLCVFSGDVNRVGFAMAIDADTGLWVVVERSRDAAGAETAEGIIFMGGFRAGNTASSNAWQQFVPMTGPPPANENRIHAICSHNASSAFGLAIGVGAPVPLAGGPKNYGVGLLVYCSGDFTANIQISVALYGVARTYYTLGGFLPAPNNINSARIAILYQ